MDHKETVKWMFRQLPMYQREGKSAFKKDLSNTLKLAAKLGNPHKDFKSIHVAGTNGKGSVSHALASVLQEADYKVGLYTSPHLKDFRERIKINGKEVSEDFVTDLIKKNKTFLKESNLSFFEMTVGMAFDYFARENVDIAVIEVGLGGRLDSTNIITPEVSVITNIGFDHVQFLGNTYEKIATEKAGIIKNNVPVVIGETQEETKSVFERIATENHAPIYFADQLISDEFHTDLKGSYQKKNIKTVIQAIRILKGFNISEEHIKSGLSKVSENTGLKGRWQILGTQPIIICDYGHNKLALSYIFSQIAT
ncbi:MAG: Mur ligase family protein, partial [Bacteroidota bacterium]